MTASEAILVNRLNPPDGSAPGSTRRDYRRLVGPVVAVVVVLAWCGVQLGTGTPGSDLLRWIAAVVLGVLAPGTALVRAVRRDTAPLVEDLGWGSAAGCLVAMTGWLADRLSPWSPGPLIWGPAVVLLLLLVPRTRVRVLSRPAPGWGPIPVIAMGLLMLVALTWMTTTGLQVLPVNPGSRGFVFSPDAMYQAGMVGELRRSLLPNYPFVAGEPLHYHWFLYAILAHLTTRTGVDPLDGSIRLGPATVYPAVLLLAAVVARRLSGRVAAGPVAMALLTVVDLSLANRWGSPQGGTASPLIIYWRASPPQALGWLAGLAALGTVAAWLRRNDDDRAVPTALLLPFFVLSAGAKSSQLPVLAAGIGLAMLAYLLQRRWLPALRAAALLIGVGAVFALATVAIYRGGAYGMILEPGARLKLIARALFPRLDGDGDVPSFAIVTAFVMVTVPLLPRLVGLIWLVIRRRSDPTGWLGLGTILGGFAATYSFRHPSQSEAYFLISAYPIATVCSAVGITGVLAGFLRRTGRPRIGVLVLAGGLALGAGAAFAVATAQPAGSPLTRWAHRHPADPLAKTVPVAVQEGWYLHQLTALGLVVIGAVGLLTIGFLVVNRFATRTTALLEPKSPTRPWLVAAPVLVVVLLGTGIYGMSQYITGNDSGTPLGDSRALVERAADYGVLPTTQSLVDGGRWLQAHSAPDDEIAVNRYCTQTRQFLSRGQGCDARDFTATALSQRRSFVAGWAYSDRTLTRFWSQSLSYRLIPFWDPARLAEEDRAFQAPTTAALNALYAQGVRWLWADLRDGPVATAALNGLADLRYTGPGLRIWQLRTAPSGTIAAGSDTAAVVR